MARRTCLLNVLPQAATFAQINMTIKFIFVWFVLAITLIKSWIVWHSRINNSYLYSLQNKWQKIPTVHFPPFPYQLGTDYLTWRGGGYGFLFRSEIFFRTTQELEFFFQNITLGYTIKTLNQIIFFFLHQNQNIFFSNIGNQNIFLEKNHNPPFKLNGRSLTTWMTGPHICHHLDPFGPVGW